MPAINVPKSDTFDQWRVKFNQLGVDADDLRTEHDQLRVDFDKSGFYQSTTPVEPSINSIWVHSETNEIRVWDGAAWVLLKNVWKIPTSTATSKTIVPHEFCHVTSNNQTITLPSAPADGSRVGVSVANFTNTTIDRNGADIQGLAENLIINQINTTVVLTYVNSAVGWRIE